jgi:hypothetical protein
MMPKCRQCKAEEWCENKQKLKDPCFAPQPFENLNSSDIVHAQLKKFSMLGKNLFIGMYVAHLNDYILSLLLKKNSE